jgi:ABC-type multidrug transport system ATPase subunit
MGLLVGEPGAGKTFTLRCFTEELNPALFKPVYFPLSTDTVDGITVASALHALSGKIDL